MVEKGEISSYSYKTIVQIPPFSTISHPHLWNEWHFIRDKLSQQKTDIDFTRLRSSNALLLPLANCSACRWREVHWVLWPTTPITPKWSLFISRNSQLRKTSPREVRSYIRNLSDFSGWPVRITTKQRNILQTWTTILVDGRGFDFGFDFFFLFFSFFSFFFLPFFCLTELRTN